MPASRGLISKLLNNPLIATPHQFVAAAFLLIILSSAAFAGPAEIPKLNSSLGSGKAGPTLAPATQQSGSSSLDVVVPTLDGSSLALPQTPQLEASPQSAAAQVQPAAQARISATPVFGKRVVPKKPESAAPAPQVGSAQFQKGLQRVSSDAGQIQNLAGSNQAGQGGIAQAGMVSSALFDFARLPAPDAAAAVPGSAGNAALTPSRSGLQSGALSPTRAVIGKLAAGSALQGRERGPAAIPGIETIVFDGLASNGNSGETTKVRINGEAWFLKRIGNSPDAEIDATAPETRALNEAGVTELLRQDALLSQSFSVAETAVVFRDGKHVFVLTKGIAAAGEGDSRRHPMSPVQRADAAILQLVVGLGDMHGANIIPKTDGGFGLIDFEKLARTPLPKTSAQKIDEQVMLKNFPLVDRLSVNDPAVYQERFRQWKADYERGGRARMDAALRSKGWSSQDSAAYLAAVDKNIETFLERLEPYLEYANGWHRRIEANRADQAARDAAPKKGFFQGLFGGGGKSGFGTAGTETAGRARVDARVNLLRSQLTGAVRPDDLLHFTDSNGLIGILASGKLLPSLDPARETREGASNAVHGDGAYFARGERDALYHLDKDGRATLLWTLRRGGAISEPVALRVKPGTRLRVGRGGPDGVPVNGREALSSRDISFLYQRLDPRVQARMSPEALAAYARKQGIGGIPLAALERFNPETRKWESLDSSWRRLKRGLGFGAADSGAPTPSWGAWGRRQLARGLEAAGRPEAAARLYERVEFFDDAQRAFEAAELPGESARLAYARFGRTGRFAHLLAAEAKLKDQLYGPKKARAKPEHQALFAAVRSAVRAAAEGESLRLAAEARLKLGEGDPQRAASLFLEAAEMALHYSFDERLALRALAMEADAQARPLWTKTAAARAPPVRDAREEGLRPSDIPNGLLSAKALESFFSERLTRSRDEAARTLRGLQKGVEDGIVFFGDHQDKTDAIENARSLRTRFMQSGERVLIISGHGGPRVDGQAVKGTHLLDAAGNNAAWFPDNAWGGLELLDVMARIGVRLDGYEKIVFATCHGGSACGVSAAVDVPVLGTDREGWLHYSSNLVVNPESGFNYGMFLRDEAATKSYRGGKEEAFNAALLD